MTTLNAITSPAPALVTTVDSTGNLVLQAVNSIQLQSGSNTITLPASTGTVVTTGSPQSGSVLQVVYGTGNTATTFTSTSYSTTGVSASITPKFSTSKILILTSVPIMTTFAGAYAGGMAIYKGASAVYTDTNAYDAGYSSTNPSTSNNAFRWGRIHLQYLDSPATTSSTTYAVYAACYAGNIITCQAASIGMITLLEVAA